MRNLIILAALLLSVGIQAQQPSRSAVVSRQAEGTTALGYSLLIEGLNKKAVEKAWKSYLQRSSKRPPGGAEKPVYQVFTNEYVAKNYIFPSISNSPVSLTANIYESRDGVRLTAWFQADGKLFGTETDSTLLEAAQLFVERFGQEQALAVQQQTLKNEQRNLKGLRNELSKQQRQQQSFEKNISRTQSNRLRTEKQLELYRAAQDTAVRQIARTQFTLNSLSPASDDYQGMKALHKEHEKALRSASSDVRKAQKSLVKADQEVRKNERRITNSKLRQTEIEKSIRLQEEKVQQEGDRLKRMNRP
ncbi:MAG TPA: hypothetical protein PKE03_04880 [Bacteroidales bacterium]|nr:hypothetical protein [Bacteroidales bacterium]